MPHHPHHHHHHHKWSMTLLLASIGLIAFLLQGVKFLWVFDTGCRHMDGDYEQQMAATHADDSLPTTTTSTTAKLHVLDSTRLLRASTARNVLTRSNPTQAICEEPLRLMFQRQDCLLQASRGDFRQCLMLLEEEADKDVNKDDSLVVAVPGPVHQLSYMAGQGTGRIIQHGVRTCLLASVLNRPCSIDLFRDRHYNLRAFLQPGTYNWETASHIVMAQNGVNISDALHGMPAGLEKGHGWEELVEKNQVPEYDNVLPMVWGTGEENKPKNSKQAIPRHLKEWDGRNTEHGHKVLLSPNFGDAWYGYGKDQIRLNTQFEKRYGPSCTANHMKTFLQNEMFLPTALAYDVHLQRRAIVLQEPQLQYLNNPNHKKQDDFQPKGELLTVRSGMSARDTLPPYGAIHLRTKILNADMYKFGVSKQQMLEGLLQCFQTLSEEGGVYQDMSWWLISDDVETAHFISQNVSHVHSYASSEELQQRLQNTNNSGAPPKTNAIAADREKAKAVKGIHSGDALKQPFGQEAMAPSIIDWMGLHESHIALITYDSAYGETGARGNGKIQTTTCGGKIQGKNIPMFYIYK